MPEDITLKPYRIEMTFSVAAEDCTYVERCINDIVSNAITLARLNVETCFAEPMPQEDVVNGSMLALSLEEQK